MKKLLTIFLLPLLSLIPKPASHRFTGSTISKTICMEYWHWYLDQTGTPYAVFQSSNVVALSLPGGRTMIDGAGCFNLVRACANDGSVWQSPQYNSLTAYSSTAGAWWTQITTDSTGATISDAIGMTGYADNYVMLRSDSSLWQGGVDDFGIFHSSGTVFMRPIKMTTGSQKFRKVVLCAYGIWAISSDGMTVYNWAGGSGTSPTTYTFSGKGTGKVLDIAVNNGNPFTLAVFVNIQQTAGSLYGHPYVMGSNYSFWGNPTSQSFSSFTDLYTQLGLTSPVYEIAVDNNTMHLTDSAGDLYGSGFNDQGEVGNGWEAVNHSTYGSWPNYGWNSFQQNPITTGIVKVGSGSAHYTHLFTNDFFTYYCDALDANDSIWVCGRNKTVVLPVGPGGTRTGLLDFADNPNNPNAQDVTSYTLAHPFTQNLLGLNWTGPTMSATTQNITTSSTTLLFSGHPALLVNAANSTDTINYTYAGFLWNQVSGPTTATFSSTTARSPTVTNLTTGTYVFGITTTDDNNGTNYTTLTINVTLPNPTIKISIGSGAINITNSH